MSRTAFQKCNDLAKADDALVENKLRRIINHCKAYQSPQLFRSVSQALLSLGLYAVLVGGVLLCLDAGVFWMAAVLMVLSAGMLVKLFTIQHDCGHGSYFKSRIANHVLGFFVSILTFTPYGFWRDAHNRHHASSGRLDKRGIGAVDTLTVDEFNRLSRGKQFMYRAYRHPSVMIFLGAPFYFIVLQRFPLAGAMPFSTVYQGLKVSQVWKSVVLLNLALVLVYGGLSILLGWKLVLGAFLPVVSMASWAGAWLFFVQHQYEDAYWARGKDWSYARAAIFGSSHYDLPQMLHWFSGNIGFHHIHHLSSLIPNYRLQECFEASEDLMSLPRLSLSKSLECAQLALWDEDRGKMIAFKSLGRPARA
ncbi:MAG: fatty acid desaturase [Parvularculaceae bacterium]